MSEYTLQNSDKVGWEAPSGAVSWGAIVAGAAGAAALSLILLVLGTGLGLSSVSPWSAQGMTAAALGLSTILWLAFTQIAASGMGGYLAGRLRQRWTRTHADEVYFRDTAHGFLAWALATLFTAALLTSTIGAIVSGGAQAGAAVVGGAAGTAGKLAWGSEREPGSGYFIDTLFRKDSSATSPAAPQVDDGGAKTSAEVARIFANAAGSASLSGADSKYLAQMVAQRTGLAPADAEKRVAEVYAQLQAKTKAMEAMARDAADKARRASAYAALWLFVSLLAGAFVASLAATYGGRRRDLF